MSLWYSYQIRIKSLFNLTFAIQSYAHQRETTVSSNDSLQFRLFSNGNFTKRKEFAPIGSEFFPLGAVPYGKENHFYHIR